ncbi:MAG: hypothetical protein Kow0077_09300 [Anaerolineae bacterium]
MTGMDRRTITVQLMSGPHDGLLLRLNLDKGHETAWVIGRSDACDIALPYDPQVSRTHARLVCTTNDETMADALDDQQATQVRFRLIDANSRNGTYLGNRKLRNEGVDLEPGQLFRVGRTWLRIEP